MTLALDQIWMACLGELRLQMTKATFDTWVRDCQALEFEDGRLVIGVPNNYTQDWLENRLKATVERTLQGIVDQPVRVTFLVTESPPADHPAGPKLELGPGDVAVRFYEFNPKGRGWLMSAKYDVWFWQPLVGCVGFATYQFFRCEEKLNSGWGEWFVVNVERIAATLAVKRQGITGVQRWTGGKKGVGRKYWQEGAFDRLEATGLAKIERLGKGKNISYRVSCLHSLPLLTPQQVETLPPILQQSHAEFLKESDIEYKEWMQLELPTLVQP